MTAEYPTPQEIAAMKFAPIWRVSERAMQMARVTVAILGTAPEDEVLDRALTQDPPRTKARLMRLSARRVAVEAELGLERGVSELQTEVNLLRAATKGLVFAVSELKSVVEDSRSSDGQIDIIRPASSISNQGEK